MNPHSQTEQTEIFPAIAEYSPPWGNIDALAPPPTQDAMLRAGGGAYRINFVSRDEEIALLAAVDSAKWCHDLQRRVQHYGYRYDYAGRGGLGELIDGGELPGWAQDISARLIREHIFAAHPQQLIVNEYLPGQGIAAHTDRDCFGPVVASLSLGGDCMMQIFPHPKNSRGAFELVLQRRSLLTLGGISRETWRHGIAPRKSDPAQVSAFAEPDNLGKTARRIPRMRRVSLTFRSIVA